MSEQLDTYLDTMNAGMLRVGKLLFADDFQGAQAAYMDLAARMAVWSLDAAEEVQRLKELSDDRHP